MKHTPTSGRCAMRDITAGGPPQTQLGKNLAARTARGQSIAPPNLFGAPASGKSFPGARPLE